MLTWLCLKSLRNSGVYRAPLSPPPPKRFGTCQIFEETSAESRNLALNTKHARFKMTTIKFWLSRNFWNFFCWLCFKWSYLSMLKGVTNSGYVKLVAMDLGTPTWSIKRLGSAVITVRAEKSTRFPIRFPLILPSLLLRRCLIDLRGRPDFCVALGRPLTHGYMRFKHISQRILSIVPKINQITGI